MTRSKLSDIKGLLLAATIIVSPVALIIAPPASAQIGISVVVAPPMLPIYAQPEIPGEGYIWTPGYWHWSESEAYYWVPGTWVRPPRIGFLWTPPYWGNEGGRYFFHEGYWGSHVGFYGGINYGFGYGGVGFDGGRWQGRGFVYNRSVNNFGTVRIQNTYVRNVTVINNSRVAFVGGEGGLRAAPTAEERNEERQQHLAATAEQTNHMSAAARNPEFSANRNHGQPAIAATQRPGQFSADKNDRPDRGQANEPGNKPVPAGEPGDKQGSGGQPPARPANPGPRPGASEKGDGAAANPQTPRQSRRPAAAGQDNAGAAHPNAPAAQGQQPRPGRDPQPRDQAGKPGNAKPERPANTHMDAPAKPPHPAPDREPKADKSKEK